MPHKESKTKGQDPAFNSDATLLIRLDFWIPVIFAYCISAELFLILCDYLFNYLNIFDSKNIQRIWDIAREKSFPTWFSSIQAHALALTVFLIAAVQWQRSSRFARTMWVLIGLFFLWIGIDDFAEIHERLGTALEDMAEKYSGKGASLLSFFLKNPSYDWHTFMVPVFALFGVGITVFLWTRFRRFNLFRYLFFGFACWVISQGLDYIEGLYVEDIPQIESFYMKVKRMLAIKQEYGVTHLFKVVEEVLEMFGTTLLWIGFLKYFAEVAHGLTFHLRGIKLPESNEKP